MNLKYRFSQEPIENRAEHGSENLSATDSIISTLATIQKTQNKLLREIHELKYKQ